MFIQIYILNPDMTIGRIFVIKRHTITALEVASVDLNG